MHALHTTRDGMGHQFGLGKGQGTFVLGREKSKDTKGQSVSVTRDRVCLLQWNSSSCNTSLLIEKKAWISPSVNVMHLVFQLIIIIFEEHHHSICNALQPVPNHNLKKPFLKESTML
jgi:hypothetical protein